MDAAIKYFRIKVSHLALISKDNIEYFLYHGECKNVSIFSEIITLIWENNTCLIRVGLRVATTWAMNGITFCFVCSERKHFSCIHVQKWLRDVQSVNVNIGFCRYCKARLNFNVTSKYIGYNCMKICCIF